MKWSIRFAPGATTDRYAIPRGQAAIFRDAIAVLYEGMPHDAQRVPDLDSLYVVDLHGYRIWFQMLEEIRTMLVISFQEI
jgi:mRNA-degrading endonuclease RelE of RelBE toxin-antitoxin system